MSSTPPPPTPDRDATPPGRHPWRSTVLVAVILAALAAGGYALRSRGTDAGAPKAAAAASAPVAVTTVLAERRDYPVQLEATGTVTPLNVVELRPQIAATVSQVHVREGEFVRAGQLLFTLDSRAAQVDVAKARAQLARDTATLADAERQLQRQRDLQAQQFVSPSAVESAQAAVDAQRAVVAADQAAVQAADVGLSYTRLVAPSAGRVGTVSAYVGSLVQPGGTALLTITQLDPIAVAFSLPQRHLPDALSRLQQGGLDVGVRLPDTAASAPALQGRLDFVDSAVDAQTGTVRVKARFANARQQLWPGAFVTVQFGVQTLRDAVLVPQAAIVRGPEKSLVYVVADGSAAPREVEIVQAAGERAVVSGLQGGERVVVDGRQNLRPGSRVAERGAGTAP